MLFRSMDNADEAIVYFNPHTIAHKKLKAVTTDQVRSAFQRADLAIFTESAKLREYLADKKFDRAVLVMMSSGTYDGIDLEKFSNDLLSKKNVVA